MGHGNDIVSELLRIRLGYAEQPFSEGESSQVRCQLKPGQTQVGSPSEDVYRQGWKIEGAKYRNNKNFEGGFVANLGGGERAGAIKRTHKGWEVGISSFDGSQL